LWDWPPSFARSFHVTRHSLLLALLCSSLSIGCATTGSTERVAQPGDEVDCEEEAPTGSHVQQDFCRTQARKREDHRKAQEWLDNAQRAAYGK
jgi:hypothetical protein